MPRVPRDGVDTPSSCPFRRCGRPLPSLPAYDSSKCALWRGGWIPKARGLSPCTPLRILFRRRGRFPRSESSYRTFPRGKQRPVAVFFHVLDDGMYRRRDPLVLETAALYQFAAIFARIYFHRIPLSLLFGAAREKCVSPHMRLYSTAARIFSIKGRSTSAFVFKLTLLTTSRAETSNTSSSTAKPLARSVAPVCTTSKMTSESPVTGASSDGAV